MHCRKYHSWASGPGGLKKQAEQGTEQASKQCSLMVLASPPILASLNGSCPRTCKSNKPCPPHTAFGHNYHISRTLSKIPNISVSVLQ